MSKIAELEEKIKNHIQTCGILTKELEELKLSAKEEVFKGGDYIVAIDSQLIEKNKVRKIIDVKIEGEILHWNEKVSNSFNHSYPLEKVRKATKEEIESHLIKEANKRYHLGVWFISKCDNNKKRIIEPYHKGQKITWYYSPVTDEIRSDNGINTNGGCCSNPTIYSNGVWAEIVSAPCPQIILNSHRVEFFDSHIKVGCTSVTVKQIEEIAKHYSK
jgi:FtsZ-binding cell division protein ZapB